MPQPPTPKRSAERRPPTPEDFVRLRIATDPRLSPDGQHVAFVVQTVAPRHDDYRHAIWLVPRDGSAPARQVTLGARHDRHPRFSPDGRSLAFLSDRRKFVEDDPAGRRRDADEEDRVQVHLLPLDGGEARRITDLPRGAEAFEWSPDGSRLLVSSVSVGATREEDARRRRTRRRDEDAIRTSDYHYIDRLRYQENDDGGFTYHRVPHLWIVDAATGEAGRLTEERTPERNGAWSPDGGRVAYTANRRRDDDLYDRSDIYVTEVDGGRTTRISGGEGIFEGIVWLPDGHSLAAIGGQFPDDAYRRDVWVFAADGSDVDAGGRNLTAEHDIFPDATMTSDVQPGEPARLRVAADGASIIFVAPIGGSQELWRVSIADRGLERLTEGRHYVSGWDAVATGPGATSVACIRSSPTELGDVHVLDVDGERRLQRVTDLNADVLAELELRPAEERRVTVDGREIQGWFIPAGDGRRPVVTEIHGGPHTLYGWAPSWEFQVLAGDGISVFYSNPRGSEGYGREFNMANLGDWGEGPTRDVLAGIDALVADGLADPGRLGLTGGSYGGYLTTWILGHDQRFAAGMTCRSVSDMTTLHLTGDISSGEWASIEHGAVPWEDFEGYVDISPIAYARNIRTPLLIQHSERDLRTTIGQAEALFTVLRSLRRPVRLMRVPDESHELTRSGTPFRRIENLRQVRDWFDHFLVRGRKRLPPLPSNRAGK